MSEQITRKSSTAHTHLSNWGRGVLTISSMCTSWVKNNVFSFLNYYENADVCLQTNAYIFLFNNNGSNNNNNNNNNKGETHTHTHTTFL